MKTQRTGSCFSQLLAAALFVAAVSGPPHIAQADSYTFTGTAGSSPWGTPTNWSPNGTPGSVDTIIISTATGGLGVDAATRTVTDFDASSISSSKTVLGANGATGATLNITGTLTKGGANNLNFRNGSATVPLSLTVNAINLLSGNGSLNIGVSAASTIEAFSATTVNAGGAGLFFFTNDGASASIQTLNMTAGNVVLRNLTSGTTTLVVNSLNGVGGSIKGSNSQAGSTGILSLASSGTSSYAGSLVNGVVGSVLSVAKSGTGTQTLSGILNTYSGGTTISDGKLNVTNASASATGTGNVDVSGGATTTLSGTGFITGLTTLTSGSRLAPGVNTSGTNTNFGVAGTLSTGTTGGLTLTNAHLDFDLATLAAGTNDKIITGALSLGSTIAFTFNGLGATLQTGTAYTLIDATSVSGFSAGNISTAFLGALDGNYTASYTVNGTTNDLEVTFGAIPEPSTWALLAFSLTTVMVLRRRRA